MSGLVERVVADWLTNSDERGYQIAFASSLARVGETVKYVSPHSSLEHGKDIISVVPNGRIKAYQLKVGDIGKSLWRTIREEVREASTVPVEVPGVQQRVPDEVFLVTTGRVSDPVKNEMSLINQDLQSRGYPPIALLQRDEIASMFVQQMEGFFPESLGPPADLVHLYLRDGRGPQANADLFAILDSLFPRGLGRIKFSRAIADVLVAAQFAAAPFRRCENFIAEIDTWMLVASLIMNRLKESTMAESRVAQALDLCWSAVEEAADRLLAEAFRREEFLEGGDALVDAMLLGYRRYLVIGYAAAFINSKAIRGINVKEDCSKLGTLLMKEHPVTQWGEGSWNYHLNIVIALRHNADESRLGEFLAAQWLQMICSDAPVRSPYWTVDDEVTALHSQDQEPSAEPLNASYSALAALGLLVRRLWRQTVASCWARLSRLDHAVLTPDRLEDLLLWRCEDAILDLTRLPVQGSWKALGETAGMERSRIFSDSNAKFLPFFLCTYPHRVSRFLSGELDFLTSPESFRSAWSE